MINILPERASGASAARRLHARAFPTYGEADLVKRLRAAGKIEVSLVAEVESKIIGHIAFRRVTFDPSPDMPAYSRGPMAEMPGHESLAAEQRLR